MATLSEILIEQHRGMFDMLDKGLSSAPEKAASDYTPDELTALRLVLHSLEAIDNYFSTRTPPNFGEFLEHGIRSSNSTNQFPSHAEIRAYLEEVKERTHNYLASLPDAAFLSDDNNWRWELLNMFFYVTNHTYTHLGHLDQLLYDESDPRGWECWTYDFRTT